MKKIFPYSKEIENKVIEMGKNKEPVKLPTIIATERKHMDISSFYDTASILLDTYRNVYDGIKTIYSNIKDIFQDNMFTIENLDKFNKYIHYCKYSKKKRVRNKYKNKLKKIIKPGYIEKILKDIEEV